MIKNIAVVLLGLAVVVAQLHENEEVVVLSVQKAEFLKNLTKAGTEISNRITALATPQEELMKPVSTVSAILVSSPLLVVMSLTD